MWNPFKKKDPLEGQRANYALAFDIVDKKYHQTRYFTLEASFGGCMIVEISGQKRNNTGVTIADKEDLTEFASIVFNLAIKDQWK